MESRSTGRVMLVLLLSILFVCGLSFTAESQGIQQSPYNAPSMLGEPYRAGQGLGPSNPLGSPGSTLGRPAKSNSLYVSDGMLRGILPLIPNLQFGYLYDFGNGRVSQGRFTADYLLPLSLSADSMIFGEAHTELLDFWKTQSFNNRVDMSFGGGFRTLLRQDSLLGVNGFYDSSRLGGTWYSSGGIGFEMAALMGNDALDFNFNWYGQLFNGNVIRNAFRYGPSNFDFQAGYSHELWNGGPDFRLSATGYKFDMGNSVYGWNGGAELWSRDGMFVLKYNVGHDRVNETYQEVGGLVNVGFQMENIFKGESPFTMPEPIFRSPRTLRYLLTRPVRRNWHKQGQSGCTGACCNLDRFLASVAEIGIGGGFFHSGQVPFPSVPYTCLDPTKQIVVEFDYTFDVAPTGGSADWDVEVQNSTFSHANGFVGTAATGLSGHISFVLNYLNLNQSVFTTNATDPSILVIDAGTHGAASSLTVSDVVIHFNQ